jgi:hypothetical protein
MPILTPEQQARKEIDRMLRDAGWQVQSRDRMRLRAARGVAVCEYPLVDGFADYVLFVDLKPIGGPVWTSFGCATSRWKRRPTCPSPRSWPKRSWKI